MAIYELDQVCPRVADSAWVADSAQVMGDVELAEDVSIWFGVVLRGDTDVIRIGPGTNIQDGSVLHADHGMPLTVGAQVTVGHKVMLHGCSMILGSPAKAVRVLTPEQQQGLVRSAEHYVENARRFRTGLHKIA